MSENHKSGFKGPGSSAISKSFQILRAIEARQEYRYSTLLYNKKTQASFRILKTDLMTLKASIDGDFDKNVWANWPEYVTSFNNYSSKACDLGVTDSVKIIKDVPSGGLSRIYGIGGGTDEEKAKLREISNGIAQLLGRFLLIEAEISSCAEINDLNKIPEDKQESTLKQDGKIKNKVFIVHGHDGETREKTARLVEKLGFEAIILHEQASRGMTIIEKIEEYSNNVDFGIVLYTPDDMGNVKGEAKDGKLKFRARQNVIFEHGFLIGKIGRHNVAPLVEGQIELPNDISGIVYIDNKDWQIDIAKEMKKAGYEIDFNKLL